MVTALAHSMAAQSAAVSAPQSVTAQAASAGAYVQNVPSKLGPSNWLGFNFDYTSGWNYFSLLRQTGYLFDPLYSTMLAALSNQSREDMKKGDQFVDGDSGKLSEASLQRRNGRWRANMIEGAVFTGMAGASTMVNNHLMHKLFKNSVAAEFGMQPGEVSTMTIRQSTNPLVQSAMDYNIARSMVRLLTSTAFFIPWGWKEGRVIFGRKAMDIAGVHKNTLLTGIIAKSFDITLERSLFRQVTAIEALEKLIKKSQRNALGEHDVNGVAKGLIDVLQQSREEAKLPTIPGDVVENLYPAMQELARNIIGHKMGINEAVFTLGGRMLVWDDKDLSLHNVRHLAKVGLQGLAKEVAAGKDLHIKALRKGEAPPLLTILDKQRLVHAAEVDADLAEHMPHYLPPKESANANHAPAANVNRAPAANRNEAPSAKVQDVAAHEALAAQKDLASSL